MHRGRCLAAGSGLIPSAALALALASTPAQTLPLPERAAGALTGTAFAAKVAPLPMTAREEAVSSEILAGNVPDFLRKLCPVQVTNVVNGKTNSATFFVTADYLAVGSDMDYLLMPLSPETAQALADKLHCTLPTRKMVDMIYAAAEVQLPPSPIPPSAAMTTVEVFSNHNAIVTAQRTGQASRHPLGALVAGHKKDVVVSARLADSPGKVAIYGWHRTNGVPIQPLYLGHTSSWVDYSQCIRLVQQKVLVNGQPKTVAEVLGDPSLAGLLSDEGVIPAPTYNTGAATSGREPAGGPHARSEPTPRGGIHWERTGAFNEKIASFELEAGVRVQVNAPAEADSAASKKPLLVFYALPNGNTIEQTIGKTLKAGDDWHYDIQHIGAQTRFLRQVLRDRLVLVAYLESSPKSWPAWRKQHGDTPIPGILAVVEKLFPRPDLEVVLAGHSGGGSLIFGYLNAVEAIPDEIVRIALLDSDYAYDATKGHAAKLAAWLGRDESHFLCVLAYDDANALLDGKPFVSAAGGTWGKSHEMQRDLSRSWQFNTQTNAGFQTFSALNGRVQFLLKENPERRILHTVQVERNGFIHSMLTGTPAENQGYEYFGRRAYGSWIQAE